LRFAFVEQHALALKLKPDFYVIEIADNLTYPQFLTPMLESESLRQVKEMTL
jgi:hypothetical protein